MSAPGPTVRRFRHTAARKARGGVSVGLPARVRALSFEELAAADWPLIHKLADRLNPAFREALIKSLTLLDEERNKLADVLLGGGDPITIAQQVRTLFETIDPRLADEAYRESYFMAEQGIAGAFDIASQSSGLNLSFDKTNPYAIQAIKELSLEVAKLGYGASLPDIKAILDQSFNGDFDVHEAARRIASTVGLTPQQARASSKYGDALYEDVRSGDLSLADYMKKMDALDARYRRQRAETIARTETIRAANRGQQLLWEEGVRGGHFDKSLTRRKWIVTPDDKLCPYCKMLDHSELSLVRLDEAWETYYGPVMHPPLHPRCRCAMGLVFLDKAAAPVERKTAGFEEQATVTAAEEWCRSNLGKWVSSVDYGGMDAAACNSTNRAMYDVFVGRGMEPKYPLSVFSDKVKGGVLKSAYAWAQGGVNMAVAPPAWNTPALEKRLATQNVRYGNPTETLKNKIAITQSRLDDLRERYGEDGYARSRYVADLEKELKKLEKALKNGDVGPDRWTGTDSLYLIMIHELGHIFHYQMTPALNGAYGNAELGGLGVDEYGYPKRKLTAAGKRLALRLSEYAATNELEVFAEAFVAYYKGEYERIPPKILKVVKDVVKEFGGEVLESD